MRSLPTWYAGMQRSVSDDRLSNRHGRVGGLPFPAECSARREYQRFDHHRHCAGTLQHLPDVDEIELPELKSVNGDYRIFKLQLLTEMNAQQTSDIAVADKHHRKSALDEGFEPLDHAATKRVEPVEGGRTRPSYENGDRRFRFGKIEVLQGLADSGRNSRSVDHITVEREFRRDDRQIAKRQHIDRRYEHGAAAHLRRVLRGADHRGADTLRWRRELHSLRSGAVSDFRRKQAAEVAETAALPTVNIFGYPA